MKVDNPIRVDASRTNDPPGGEWEALDTFARGYVSLVEVEDASAQAVAVLAEIERLRGLDPKPDWQELAILARTHEQLATVRALLAGRLRAGVPWPHRNYRMGVPDP